MKTNTNFLNDFLKTTALLFTFISSFFLIRGTLNMSIDYMAKLSSTRWGHSIYIAENLSNLKADTLIGFLFLFASIFIEINCSLWVVKKENKLLSKSGIFYAILISLVIFCISYYSANIYSNRLFDQIRELLQ